MVPEDLFTSKINQQSACGYSLFRRCSFDSNKIKHNFRRSKEHATEIINREKRICCSGKERVNFRHTNKNYATNRKYSMRNLIKTRGIKTFTITAITPDSIEAKSLPLHQIR